VLYFRVNSLILSVIIQYCCKHLIYAYIQVFFQYAGGYGERKAYDITSDGTNSKKFEPIFAVEAALSD